MSIFLKVRHIFLNCFYVDTNTQSIERTWRDILENISRNGNKQEDLSSYLGEYLFKGGDHCLKSEIFFIFFLHFLKDVCFKNVLSKFYEEIRKIDGYMVCFVERCQTREWASRNIERVFLRITFFNRVDSLQRKLYVQLTWARTFIVRKTRGYYVTISFFHFSTCFYFF